MNDEHPIFFFWLNRSLRFLGYFWLLGGLIMAIISLVNYFYLKQPFYVDGIVSNDSFYKYMAVVIPLLIAIFGVLFIKVKPINKTNNPQFFKSFETPKKAKQPWQ